MKNKVTKTYRKGKIALCTVLIASSLTGGVIAFKEVSDEFKKMTNLTATNKKLTNELNITNIHTGEVMNLLSLYRMIETGDEARIYVLKNDSTNRVLLLEDFMTGTTIEYNQDKRVAITEDGKQKSIKDFTNIYLEIYPDDLDNFVEFIKIMSDYSKVYSSVPVVNLEKTKYVRN